MFIWLLLVIHYFGDTLYGNKSDLIHRQALHSYKIKCIHPISKKSLAFESTLPEDIKYAIGIFPIAHDNIK